VILAGADPAVQDRFLARHGRGPLAGARRVRALELMELGRHAMAMYTSCGWFFDDLAGIETVQILTYAARACELGRPWAGDPLEVGFVDRLAAARANDPAIGDGRAVWQRLVDPEPGRSGQGGRQPRGRAGGDRREPDDAVGAHAVIAVHDLTQRRVGRATLAAGAAQVTERATGASRDLAFAVLHLGDHQLVGGVREFPGTAAWDREVDLLVAAFGGADLFAVQREIDRGFAGVTFSLGTLLARDREAILATVLAGPAAPPRPRTRRSTTSTRPVLRFLVPTPAAGAAGVRARRDPRA
jgi:hypothetical protein